MTTLPPLLLIQSAIISNKKTAGKRIESRKQISFELTLRCHQDGMNVGVTKSLNQITKVTGNALTINVAYIKQM